MASYSKRPRYSWTMLSSAHMIRKRKKRKLKALKTQCRQVFDVHSLHSSEAELAADTIAPGMVTGSDLASSNIDGRTRVDVTDTEIGRNPKNSASSAKDPSMPSPRAHRTARRERAEAKHMHRTALRRRLRVPVNGDEESTDCVPETSQESLPSHQPNSCSPSNGADIDNEPAAPQPMLGVGSRALEGALCAQEARKKKKKKHKRRELHDAVKESKKKKKKKRRRREGMEYLEGDAQGGLTEGITCTVVQASKEEQATAEQATDSHEEFKELVEEEEEKEMEEKEESIEGVREEEEEEETMEEEEEMREEEMEKKKEEERREEEDDELSPLHMQKHSPSQSGRKRRVVLDGAPASSRRRLFMPDSSECEGTEGEQEEEEDQYQYLHESWQITPEDEIKFGSWCKGAWTKQEAKLLNRNVKTYVKENGIKDLPDFLLERGRKPQCDFFKKIAKGINRPLFAIYRKACRVYSKTNYLGQFTEDEDMEIMRLQALHGNKWKLIGDKMDRSACAVRTRYNYINRKDKTGQWTEEEEDRLSKSVLSAFRESATNQLNEDNEGDVPPCDALLPDTKTWDLVSSEVGTRSAQQCRHKWYYHLCWKTSGELWTFADNLRLVREVSALDIDADSNINWQALADGWPEARSGYYLRRKWASLKRYVPSYETKELAEILDYLHSEKVPVWQKNLERGIKGSRSSLRTTPKTPIMVDEDSDN